MSFRWWRRRLFEDVFDEIFRDIEYMLEQFERQFASLPEPAPGKPIVYGVRITIGPDGKPIVEEFGNIRKERGRPLITEEREPLVDVYDEKDKVTIIAELPGVDKDKIDIRVVDGKLVIKASNEKRKYYKEIELPEDVDIKTAKAKYNNGVLEIVIQKKKKEEKEEGVKIKIE